MHVTFIIGLGSNLTTLCGASPLTVCQRAIPAIVSATGGDLLGTSGWYRTAAVPVSAQPDYVNGVVLLASALSPWSLLHKLQEIEAAAGRVRGERNAARVLDLDVLAIDDTVIDSPALTVPHPRMAERAFVLHPLCDVAPWWRHPVLGLTATALRDRVTGQRIERIASANEALPSPGGTLT